MEKKNNFRIATVINATAEKSETERFQIVVKAVVHHLCMKIGKWEELRVEMSIKASQENNVWVNTDKNIKFDC